MYYFYWLPMGTDAKVRGIPWITWSIAVANVVAFAALHSLPGAEADAYRLAFKAGEPSIQTAIVSLFLHASPLLLLLNLTFLAFFGPPLESRLGPARFLVAFIAGGWLSNLAQAAWVALLEPDMGLLPIVGAAGAISGLMGIFLVRLSFAHFKFASLSQIFLKGVWRTGRQTIPAVVAIVIWFLVQAGISLSEPVPEAALAGHLGGLLFGMLFGWSMGIIADGKLERMAAAGSRLAAKGEWFAALSEFDGYLLAAPDDPEVLVDAARVERVTHQDARSGEHFRRAIHLWLERGRFKEACDAFDEMKRLLGAVALAPNDQLRVARGCEILGRPADASRAYEAYGRHYPDRDGAVVALLKSAEIELGPLNNPGRARYLYDELLRRPLPPDIEQVVRARGGVSHPSVSESAAREESLA